jgi:hypothetical protein
MNKKIAFWLNVSLAGFMFIMGVELLAIIPFIVFSVLTGYMVFKNRDFKVGALVLAIIMAVLNLAIPEPSAIDVLVWVLSAILLVI